MLRRATFVALVVFLVACTSAAPTPNEISESGQFTISPLFLEFYTRYGGEKTFGQPISPERDENGIIAQYFQNANLEYYPQFPEGSRVLLANLGDRYYGRSPCVPAETVEPGALYLDDCHSVSPEFRPYFESMDGPRFFGYPTSERYIFDNMLVQNFERAVIVWDASKPAEYQFGILPLGLQACRDNQCNADPGPARLIPPVATSTPHPGSVGSLSDFYAKHGGPRVFGIALSAPRVGSDGAMEQVYEKAILYLDPSTPEGVGLRPLGKQVLAQPEPPAPPASGPSTIYFSDYGHNVKLVMYDFFTQYGGEAVFGQPISEWRIVGNHFEQYFENTVFTYRLDLPPDQGVQLVDLGRQALLAQSQAAASGQAAPQMIRIAAEPLFALYAPASGDQTLTAKVVDQAGMPVAGARVAFVVHTPDGDMEHVSTTDALGFASYTFGVTSFVDGGFMLFEATASLDQLSATAEGQFVTWKNPAP